MAYPALLILWCLIFPSAVFSESGQAVDGQYKVGSAPFAENEKALYKFSVIQPYAFNLRTIQRSMASLAFQKKLLSWSNKKRVFPSSIVRGMAPKILEKFREVGSDRRIVFKVAGNNGKTTTRGDTFLTPEGLHWRFTVLSGSIRKIGDFSVMGETWKLVPLKGQHYKKKIRSELNDLVQEMTNWLVLKKYLPVASRFIKKPSGHLPQRKGSGDPEDKGIKVRLKLLEELREEGLITENEYKKKRGKILDTL